MNLIMLAVLAIAIRWLARYWGTLFVQLRAELDEDAAHNLEEGYP